MPDYVYWIATALLAGFVGLLWRRQRWLQRRQRLLGLLDLCDSLESLLDRSQLHMQELQAVVGRVPSDIGAVAASALETGLPVREAKRDVLQHRLWIQQQGETASLAALERARLALERSQARLASQLRALESAGAELANATAASEELARREPPTLRRPPASP